MFIGLTETLGQAAYIVVYSIYGIITLKHIAHVVHYVRNWYGIVNICFAHQEAFVF